MKKNINKEKEERRKIIEIIEEEKVVVSFIDSPYVFFNGQEIRKYNKGKKKRKMVRKKKKIQDT